MQTINVQSNGTAYPARTVAPVFSSSFAWPRASAGDGRASGEKQRETQPEAAPADAQRDKDLLAALVQSQTYQDFERAFSEAMGMPVALRPVESWQLPHHGKKNESPFCALMVRKSRACAACLLVQEKVAAAAQEQPKTVTCSAGLCETAVPVKTGGRLIGYLQAGQVFRRRPTSAQFAATRKLLGEYGLNVDGAELKEAYYRTRVVLPPQHAAMVDMLAIFAQQLSILGHQISAQREKVEPPVILRAKEYIKDNHSECLRLGQVAKAVHCSTFYFCKLFKKVTGRHFTDYVARIRIERAKTLLLNPNLHVSEIAFAVGFQSLTHFNRIFKKITGQSPTEYRARLHSNPRTSRTGRSLNARPGQAQSRIAA